MVYLKNSKKTQIEVFFDTNPKHKTGHFYFRRGVSSRCEPTKDLSCNP